MTLKKGFNMAKGKSKNKKEIWSIWGAFVAKKNRTRRLKKVLFLFRLPTTKAPKREEGKKGRREDE